MKKKVDYNMAMTVIDEKKNEENFETNQHKYLTTNKNE